MLLASNLCLLLFLPLSFNLGLQFFKGFVYVALQILGDTQDRLTASHAISTDSSHQPSIGFSLSALQLLSKPRLTGRSEECQRGHGPD